MRGKVLAPVTSVVLNGNRLVRFATVNVSFHLFILFIKVLKDKRTKIVFFIRVSD